MDFQARIKLFTVSSPSKAPLSEFCWRICPVVVFLSRAPSYRGPIALPAFWSPGVGGQVSWGVSLAGIDLGGASWPERPLRKNGSWTIFLVLLILFVSISQNGFLILF